MEIQIVETNAMLTLKALTEDIIKYKSFYICTGDSGFGKTEICSYLRKEFPDNVVYHEVRPSQAPTTLFSKIANLVGDRRITSRMKLDKIIELGAEQFNNSSRNHALIIDQANKLNPRMLEYIHEFRDLTKKHLGILMIGTTALTDDIDTWVNKKKSGMEEFKGRVTDFIDIPEPDESDVISIIRAQGINNKEFEIQFKNLKNLHRLREVIRQYWLAVEKNMIDLENSKN